MNPLDKEELKAFFKIIKKDMPIHTENTAKIKRLYSQGMPKNLMEYSNKVDNKFLNNNLHIIEEMESRKKGITDDFKNYQNKYYDESGILNHDLYFEHDNKIYSKISGGSFFNQSFLSTSFASLNRSSKVLGAEVETDGTTSTPNNSTANFIDIGKCSNFVVNTWYDQTKFHINVAAGNVRTCLYLDSSNTPDVLGGESASLTAVANYTTIYPIGECQILTTTGWIGHNCNSDALRWRYWAGGGTYRHYATSTYGAFPNPLTGDSPAADSSNVMKASHS